ncbi:hypothetical protein ACFYWX_10090 [Streptomyces sp. NPDC002888]|uniref:hypothetical protein n=1 Tax=Streptomyces sp. NPDC002888 TaxID=3364668 RepID=UPI0036A98BAB
MGTKTVDEAAAADVKHDDETVDATEATGVSGVTDTPDVVAETEVDEIEAAKEEGAAGVGQGAGAVVSAGLGIVSLTGSWVGTVASARESLIGQLQNTQSSSVAKMIKEGYGDAWQATALWGGVFALVALVVGVVVLARPAFGAPGRPQAPWIKSVAWAGVSLGVLGLFLAVLKYTDVLLGLPSAG